MADKIKRLGTMMRRIMEVFTEEIAGAYVFRLKIEPYMDGHALRTLMHEVGKLYSASQYSHFKNRVLHFKLDYSNKRNFIDIYIHVEENNNKYELGKIELFYDAEHNKLVPLILLS